jgi:hypothetical protein
VQQLLFRCVQDLFGLDHVTRDLVIHRLASRQPIKDCAEKHGISQAVAHARVKEAARRHPWINAAISINS